MAISVYVWLRFCKVSLLTRKNSHKKKKCTSIDMHNIEGDMYYDLWGKKKHMSTDMLEIETRPGRGGPTEHIYDLARGLGANQRWLVFTLHMYSYCLLFPPLFIFGWYILAAERPHLWSGRTGS